MWNAGPSKLVADSILTVASLSWGNSTRCERQSAALLWAADIHLKVILYVASSNPHLFTVLLAFFPLRNLTSGLWLLSTIISAPLKVIIPFCDCIMYTVGYLFCSAPFLLCISEGV